MTDTIIVALITGGISLIGIFISAKSTRDSFTQQIDKKVAVIETQMAQMQKQLEEHNHYAKLFSESVPVIKEQIKVINHRIDDLERITGEMRKS